MTVSIAIDGDKLKSIFRRKGIYLKDASRELGYDISYLSSVCTANKIGKPAIISLEKIFDIKFEEYAPHKDEETSGNDKLLADIRVMVYDTVKQALKEYFGE